MVVNTNVKKSNIFIAEPGKQSAEKSVIHLYTKDYRWSAFLFISECKVIISEELRAKIQNKAKFLSIILKMSKETSQ